MNTSAFPGMCCSTSFDTGTPGAEKVIVTSPGGTSSSRNDPVSATPPETYGAFSTQTFVPRKRSRLRAASVSTV